MWLPGDSVPVRVRGRGQRQREKGELNGKETEDANSS